MTGTKQSDSLQALRALAFTGIFLLHASAGVEWAALGVSTFFVLSGFLLTRRHYEETYDLTPAACFSSAVKRVGSIYPLHLLTMLFAVALNIYVYILDGWTPARVCFLLGKIFFNITLTQSWVPSTTINCSLNGVAWFLSVSLFLYFMFPYVVRRVRRFQTKRSLAVCCGSVLLVQIAACAVMVHVPPLIDDSFFTWFSYCFPLFRLGDFVVGCCLGAWTLRDSCADKPAVWKYTAFEILALLLTIAVYRWTGRGPSGTLWTVLKNNTTVYIPLAAVWVSLFFSRSGWITRVLTARPLIFIGNISAELFLIHYVVTRYTEQVIALLPSLAASPARYCVIAGEYGLSVLLALLYRRCRKRGKRPAARS